MKVRKNLYDLVRPVYGSNDGKSYDHTGTGFIVRHLNKDYLVTARHSTCCDFVVLIKPASEGKGLQGVEWCDAVWNLRSFKSSKVSDLAILEIEGYDGPEGFNLTKSRPEQGMDVYSYEYAQLSEERFDQQDRRNVRLHERDSLRKGHIVRLIGDHEDFHPDCSFELSFPAGRGASGAPVISVNNEIVGIIIRNAGVQLDPIDVPGEEEIIEATSNEHEEKDRRVVIRYLMPAGVAMGVDKLIALFEGA